MKRLFGYANEYVRQSDWKDLALLKFCLCSAGILIGTALPQKVRKPVVFTAMGVFIATYIPLILKFLRIAGEGDKEQ